MSGGSASHLVLLLLVLQLQLLVAVKQALLSTSQPNARTQGAAGEPQPSFSKDKYDCHGRA